MHEIALVSGDHYLIIIQSGDAIIVSDIILVQQ